MSSLVRLRCAFGVRPGCSRVVLALALASMLVGCGDTGRDRVSVPLYVAGTAVTEPVIATGDVPIVLERADLAFGPLVLCAGAQAGDLCETAVLEWLDAVVVDTADAGPVAVGELTGVTGTVRSWMFDLGLSSQLTEPAPIALDAAMELGGVSLVIEGTADVDGVPVVLSARIPIRQTEDTERGVPVVRKSTTDVFEHTVAVGEPALVVTFDPRPWVQGIDVRACVVSGECVGTLAAEADSQAFRSIRNAVVSGPRPAFEWRAP